MNIKNTAIIGSLLALNLASTAQAADLPQRGPAPVPLAVSVFTWSGPYIGVTAGGTFSARNNGTYTYVDPLEGPPPSRTTFGGNGGSSNGSFIAGAEIGYNWQSGSIVYGLEGDLNFTGRNNKGNGFFARRNCELTACAFGADGYDHFLTNGHNGFGTFGTIRGRLGVAMDRALFFVTGGFAFGGSGSASVSDYRLQGVPTRLGSYGRPDVTFGSTTNDSNNWGYALGGGLEYAITNNLTLKGEYLYVSLRGGQSGLMTASNANFGTLTSNSSRNSVSLVRAGLNYKFNMGGNSGSVVARY